MPLYSYKDENGNELVIRALWNDIKTLDSQPEEDLASFLKEAQEKGNIMSGEFLQGSQYKRVLCSPALKFKGSGWHVNDYGKGSTG